MIARALQATVQVIFYSAIAGGIFVLPAVADALIFGGHTA